jgi:K(+)-stimulated pyrophosphate-energized sodium pump
MLVLTGVSAGLRSVALPVLIVAGGFFSAYQLADFYGIALAALSLLSLTGMVVSLSAFGPIADNAAGLLAMSDPSSHAAKHLQRLDAVGNTVKAITKGYSSSAASLTAIVLFHTFIVVLFAHAPASDLVFSLTEPLVLAGVLAGAFVPFFFASQCLTAVTRTARRAAEEIRRLLHAKSSTAKVSHGSFTTWLTSASLRAMFAPALFALVLPVVVSFYLGMPLFVGFFAAVLVVGFVLSLVLVNTGNAWDNAKKHIEDDHHGGKGSLAYQAASVGDFIGDPYKDTAGPALSSLIKLTSIIALLAATLAA